MRFIVCHPAQQHSFQLAIAAKRAGVLEKYITTVYDKKRSLTEAAAGMLRGKYRQKARSRRCEELGEEEILQFCEAEGLLKLLFLNIPFLHRLYYPVKYHLADRFARKVAAYAIKSGADAVITYDDTSPLLFEILAREAPQIRRIMDVSAANTLYMRQIYERDLKLAPGFAGRLKTERAIVWDPVRVDRTRRELKAAETFLVPSAFVKKSLMFSGISEDRIHVCPYGVSTVQFHQKQFPETISRPIRFVYVGGVKELKGIYYLLEAFQRIPKASAELIVVGQCDPKDPDLAPYLERVTFLGSILHDEMDAVLRSADVFILPSLGEGLSLAAMEAAMCGLPLIVSENSGIVDLMTDGAEGYIIPIQSTEAIVGAVQRLIDCPENIRTMGQAAHEMAMNATWDAYYEKMGGILKNLEKDR